MTDRAVLLREDAGASPEALERLAERHATGTLVPDRAGDLLGGVGRGRGRLVLVGLGSSRYAADVVVASLRDGGKEACVELPSRDRPVRLAPGEVLVAISSSGRTAEVVEAASRHAGRAIAVTNEPHGPLAAAAVTTTLLLHAGVERSGVATRTYRATLAVLGLATGLLSVEDLRAASEAIRTVTGDHDDIARAADLLDGADAIDVIVPASRGGAGEQAALMFREGPRLRATSTAEAEWGHTAIYTALPGHRAVLLGPSAYGDEIAATIGERGGTTVAIGGGTRGAALTVPVPLPEKAPPLLRAIVESVVPELIAAELWTRVTAAPTGEPG